MLKNKCYCYLDVKQYLLYYLHDITVFFIERHYQHFTQQLAQMTLSYLHNLMEDGAELLEAEDLQDSSSATHTGCTVFYQEIKSCLEFLTESTVELRCHLSNMPVDGTEKADFSDGNQISFACIKGKEEAGTTERWFNMTEEVMFINKETSVKL